ncbi:MAG: aldo/keto reductase, partial [Mycobacteriales bacterium]
MSIEGVADSVSSIAIGVMKAMPDDPGPAFAILDAFAAAGGNLVDTAHVYGDGAVDLTLGKWLAARGRDAAMVLGKGCHPKPDGVPRVTPAALEADLGESLDRLGTDYLDIFVLHRDDEAVPVGELIDALNRARDAGRIMAFGASNWSTQRVVAANDYAAAHGLVPFALNNPGWSLARPVEPMWPGCVYVDDEYARWHRQSQLPLLAWSAQAAGFFSGRYESGDGRSGDVVRTYYSDDNFARLHRAQLLAQRHGVTAIGIALAYVLSQPFPTIALVGPGD